MTKEQIINQYISVYEGYAMEKEELEIMLNGFADDIVNNLEPSLPDNLDEAAEEWCKRNNKGIALCGDKKSHYLTEGVDAFKAGAEWMAKQGVKARCIESCNPVSSNKDERLHLITLLYTENENTPYVVGGDTIELIIQKKQ